MELTTSELTILGLVIGRPQHCYGLEHVIHRRRIRQWTDIGISSIYYYLLMKLEKRGLIRAPEQAAGTKSRRIFHATPEGRATACRTALALIEKSAPAQYPILAGRANLPLLSEERYAAATRSRFAEIDARLEAAKSAQQVQGRLPLAAREVFSHLLRDDAPPPRGRTFMARHANQEGAP